MTNAFEIPQAAADAITIANVTQWRDYLIDELKQWEDNPRSELNPNGYWLHPDDVVGNKTNITACNMIIRAFGGIE
jgi:hypothetical protein